MSELLLTVLYAVGYVLIVLFLVCRFHVNWTFLFLVVAAGWFTGSIFVTPPLTVYEVMLTVFLVSMAFMPDSWKKRIISLEKAKRGEQRAGDIIEKPKRRGGVLILGNEYGHLGGDGEFVPDGKVPHTETAKRR